MVSVGIRGLFLFGADTLVPGEHGQSGHVLTWGDTFIDGEYGQSEMSYG